MAVASEGLGVGVRVGEGGGVGVREGIGGWEGFGRGEVEGWGEEQEELGEQHFAK